MSMKRIRNFVVVFLIDPFVLKFKQRWTKNFQRRPSVHVCSVQIVNWELVLAVHLKTSAEAQKHPICLITCLSPKTLASNADLKKIYSMSKSQQYFSLVYHLKDCFGLEQFHRAFTDHDATFLVTT
ncbi:hypothetical protein AcV5_007984 [Taiwanofungus camphoratus]|nr:hypothetical protein AcW2_007618 [Antrodia cinnamomea]KAI0927442.1 hypothetical protein AcV5_007984 [Antrodia cinnamomea]